MAMWSFRACGHSANASCACQILRLARISGRSDLGDRKGRETQAGAKSAAPRRGFASEADQKKVQWTFFPQNAQLCVT